MGYADRTNAAGSGPTPGSLPGSDHASRFRAGVSPLRIPGRRSAAKQTSHAAVLLDVLEHWTVDNFERQRATLERDRQRQACRLRDFVRALYAVDDGAYRRIAASTGREAGDPQDLAQNLLGPAARRAGEDWRNDDADFLQVTIALSRLQLLFREACSRLPPPAPRDRTRSMLLASAPGSQHDFGVGVVEDAFCRGGWRVDGGGNDGHHLLSLAACRPYRIIGLSVGAERDIEGLRNFTEALRSRSCNPSVVLMAGGPLAVADPQALVAAGFDWVAADAATAVGQAAAIAASRPDPALF